MAVSLLTEIWNVMPNFFSNMQHRTSMLTNDEYEQEDFGLQERLNTQNQE